MTNNRIEKKFKYNLRLEGHGGQISVSKINRNQYQYWSKNQHDLINHLMTEDGFNSINKNLRLIKEATYWEKGNILYEYGVEYCENSFLIVKNDNEEEIFTTSLDIDELEEKNIEIDEKYDPKLFDDVLYYYDIRHAEKGEFLNQDLELDEKFDPSKIKIVYSETNDWYLVTNLYYDNNELVEGSSTDSKGVSAFVNEL